MKVAFNSSPLIFLSKLAVLDQAISLFSVIVVPESVYTEVVKKEDIARQNLERLLEYENAFLTQVKNIKMSKALGGKLGKGESEAIVIAIENLCDVVVLDDNVARREASRYGINVKGTLGIIKKMLAEGLVHFDLDRLYEDLQRMNFRVKRNIYEGVFRDKE